VSVEIDGSVAHVETRVASGATIKGGLATEYERLKPGPGRSAEEVRTNQRARIHRAMVELTGEKGYQDVTVRALTRTAGVSSRTFYRHFPNREECVASTIDDLGHELLFRSIRRTANVTGWEAKIRALLDSLFGDFSSRPKAARLLLVEALAAGLPGRIQAVKLTADLERLLGRLFAADLAPAGSPQQVVAGVAAGVVRVATRTTLTGRAGELRGLSGHLGDWISNVHRMGVATGSGKAGAGIASRGRRESPTLPTEASAFAGFGEDERIRSAALKLASDGGFAALSIPRIRREAGVSRRSFDERFGDAAECFLVAVDGLARTAAGRAVGWARKSSGARPSSQKMILALCVMAARNQPQARLILISILAAGRDGLLHRERLISEAARWLSAEGSAPSANDPIASEASVAAAWRIAQREIQTGRARNLPRTAPLLSQVIGIRPADLPI
jgi:AcrR family transcriptional regulator